MTDPCACVCCQWDCPCVGPDSPHPCPDCDAYGHRWYVRARDWVADIRDRLSVYKSQIGKANKRLSLEEIERALDNDGDDRG